MSKLLTPSPTEADSSSERCSGNKRTLKSHVFSQGSSSAQWHFKTSKSFLLLSGISCLLKANVLVFCQPFKSPFLFGGKEGERIIQPRMDNHKSSGGWVFARREENVNWSDRNIFIYLNYFPTELRIGQDWSVNIWNLCSRVFLKVSDVNKSWGDTELGI